MASLLSALHLPSASPAARGSMAMLLGMFLFTLNDTLVKLSVAHLPTSEVMVLRGIFCIAMVGGLVIKTCGFKSLKQVGERSVLTRSFFEGMASICYVTALAYMGLAEMLSLMQTAPLMITALSLPLLGIAVGRSNWIALGVGFIGVLAIVQPTPSGFNPMSLFALGAAFCVSLRDISTRRINTAVHSLIVTLCASIFACGAGVVVSPFQNWVMPTATEMFYIIAAAVVLSVGNLCVILAFRGTDIAIVGPLRYTVVLWALIFSAVIWNVLPGPLALAGAALIVLSGVYTLLNAAATRRKALKSAPPV